MSAGCSTRSWNRAGRAGPGRLSLPPQRASGVDRHLLHAWLAARSVARGLPAPVADRGGYRVDTNGAAEVRRWVFPDVTRGLTELGQAIHAPRHLLKLCGSAEALRDALPDHWQVEASGHFMQGGTRCERPVPAGYRIETDRVGPAIAVRIWSTAGELAASGYGAETEAAFAYDRIATAPGHRRKGLGAALMAALQATKRGAAPELLVATEEGRALYATLGWRVVSAYATASLPDP